MKYKSRYVLLLSMAFCACNTNNYISSIPETSVNLHLNLNTEYATFINPTDYLIFEERRFESDRIGFGGVFIYIGFDGNYAAFDMACPVEATRTIKVSPDNIGRATCNECGEVYDVSYGFGLPTKGIGKQALRAYKVRKQNNILHITLK